jgi:transposase-like protein
VCGRQSSVTAGTIFHRTRTPLTVWFAAAWQLTSQKHGISALGLQRVLGLGSYQTAWAMLHRYRAAMVRPGRERLRGWVEVDETYIGGDEPGLGGRLTGKKATVAVAVEVQEPRGFGRIRLQRVPDVTAASLVPFVCDVLEPGATVQTDGWNAYHGITDHGYHREKTVLSTNPDPAHVAMPAVHRVVALLKRWLLGTHQGAVSAEHLDAYLNEFTFRFNRRASRRRGLLFYRLLEQAVVTDPIAYADLIATPRPGSRRATAPTGVRPNPTSLTRPSVDRPWRGNLS